MTGVISDGNYHSVGYGGLDRVIVGGGNTPARTYEGDRLMHFFGTDRYVETGTLGNMEDDVRVLLYADICDLKAFRQVKNIHGDIVPGILVMFRNGAQLLITLESESEVQDLAKFLRMNMAVCRPREGVMHR